MAHCYQPDYFASVFTQALSFHREACSSLQLISQGKWEKLSLLQWKGHFHWKTVWKHTASWRETSRRGSYPRPSGTIWLPQPNTSAAAPCRLVSPGKSARGESVRSPLRWAMRMVMVKWINKAVSKAGKGGEKGTGQQAAGYEREES